MMGMMFLWILVPVALIWLASDRARGQNGGAAGNALRILEDRFARGEIDEEEFRAKRLMIEGPAR